MTKILEKVLTGQATPEEKAKLQEAPLSELLQAIKELGLDEVRFLEGLLDLE